MFFFKQKGEGVSTVRVSQAGRILGKYAHGMDFKNAYVVLDAPQSVPILSPRVRLGGRPRPWFQRRPGYGLY